ncbi:MAG: gliding motility protein GldM [Chitinophagales bacterium]|nr:gliding motility protein GldM [Bacteroidota bacterium]MCB9043560.1 gliding motility protein GldM [Chitinophagales bacterium]
MSIPKEPRQQMINIMYLVLIALLALNVSNEIVNAFKMLDKGINDSSTSIDKKIDNTQKAFAKAVEKNPSGQYYLDQAEIVLKYQDEFLKYLNGLRDTINTRAGGTDTTGWVKKLDDQEVPTVLMVEQKKGDELGEKIMEYRQKYLDVFNGDKFTDTDRQRFEQACLLKTDPVPADSKIKDASWGTYTFYQMPLVSVITLLDKFKNDTKNTTAAALDILKNKVSEEEILFDSFDVAIVPNSRNLIQGETFEADVFLTASSSQSKPSISINGRGYPANAGGRAKYTAAANSLGKQSVNVTIGYTDGFGQKKTSTGKMEYSVVSPPDHVAVVSPTKMNVFYIGVDNPVAASITGIREDQTNVSMSGGTINKQGAGSYVVRVTSPGTATINISGKKKDGSPISKAVEFRVKRIPDPVPMIGKQSGGSIKTGEFKAQQGVRAALDDFVFDAKFEVKSFEMTRAAKGQDLEIAVNQGAMFDGRSRGLIDKASPGDLFYFDKIKAVGPDGTPRTLPSITFKIQ